MQISFLRENIRTYANIKGSPRLIFEEAKWQRSDKKAICCHPALISERHPNAESNRFVPAAPAIVRVDASETGTEMAGIVDGRAISGFATKCTGDIGFWGCADVSCWHSCRPSLLQSSALPKASGEGVRGTPALEGSLDLKKILTFPLV